ncbi:MAG: hypothetical protein CMM47_09530 [Rhodospirillaceae bacterium]|nr:hypothetical protein [Rhodospirillaceae bacterium]
MAQSADQYELITVVTEKISNFSGILHQYVTYVATRHWKFGPLHGFFCRVLEFIPDDDTLFSQYSKLFFHQVICWETRPEGFS